VKINILSDLHLSRGELDPPRTGADVVVLAGDIARPAAAVEWARRLGKPVVYVPGNHEFYGASLPGTVGQLHRLAAGSPVHVLDDGEVTLGGVRFLGSTLWTDFRLFGEGEMRDAAVGEALRLVHDFRRIHLDDAHERLFTPLDAAALFMRHSAWLRARLAQAFDGPTIVVTHHAPSPRSIEPRFQNSLLNACFASDAEHLVAGSGAALWIHGHMHHSVDYTIGATRVVSNPRGYVVGGRNENPHFDPGFVVEVG